MAHLAVEEVATGHATTVEVLVICAATVRNPDREAVAVVEVVEAAAVVVVEEAVDAVVADVDAAMAAGIKSAWLKLVER